MFASTIHDRRRRPRLRLTYFVRLHLPGEGTPIETKTEDVSCDGFFCRTERDFKLQDLLDCELVIPGKDHGFSIDKDMVLRCQVKVVRVVSQVGGRAFGLACQLADYRIRQTSANDDGLDCGFELAASALPGGGTG